MLCSSPTLSWKYFTTLTTTAKKISIKSNIMLLSNRESHSFARFLNNTQMSKPFSGQPVITLERVSVQILVLIVQTTMAFSRGSDSPFRWLPSVAHGWVKNCMVTRVHQCLLSLLPSRLGEWTRGGSDPNGSFGSFAANTVVVRRCHILTMTSSVPAIGSSTSACF